MSILLYIHSDAVVEAVSQGSAVEALLCIVSSICEADLLCSIPPIT